MNKKTSPPPATPDPRITQGVIAVREGPSANCSSIGSVVDTLFVTAAVGGALFAAVAAAVQREKNAVRVVGEPTPIATEEETEEETEEKTDAPPT